MIELDDVHMSYGERPVLQGLGLRVEAGEVYGLLGPNGAGKSTTIHIITGLLRPKSGRVMVAGVDALARPTEARSAMAYVPESVALYPHLTGIENLRLFSTLAGRRLSRTACAECLERAGLQTDAHGRRVERYSKGMRQKVGIGIALAKEACALILDEPSSGLDPSASRELALAVRALSSNGVAVLMATHDLFRARETCDSVGLLMDGSLRAEWAADEIQDRDLEAAYLEVVTPCQAKAGALSVATGRREG